MKKTLKLIALLLSVLTVMCVLAACGGGADTTAEVTDPIVTEPTDIDSSVTEAPETDAPDTQAPETDAPETDAPEAPALPTEIILDFETDKSLADYVLQQTGAPINLKSGAIADGKLTQEKNGGFAFRDAIGLYDAEKWVVEFEVCFTKWIEKDNDSFFTFILDDDGTLNAQSKFLALKAFSDGRLCWSGNAGLATQLELGKAHSFKIEIDGTTNTTAIYFDGEHVYDANFYSSSDIQSYGYRCFRFGNTGAAGTYTVDNFKAYKAAE